MKTDIFHSWILRNGQNYLRGKEKSLISTEFVIFFFSERVVTFSKTLKFKNE